MSEKIPDQVKQTVTFIFVKISQGGGFQANGTGFFVSVPDKARPDRVFGYLVTARHVLQDPNGEYLKEVFVRLNKKSGGSDLLQVPLVGEKLVNIYTHSDSTVDIAVLPMLPDPTKYDIKTIPENMITTRQRFLESKIGEGDEVFFTGLFTPFFGATRNYPIVRFGRVAMITDERIPWQGRSLDLYLIESQSFGGNSGSPVFFYLGATREAGSIVIGPPTLLLAGVMMGSFLQGSVVELMNKVPTPISFENAGIAAVVPAYYLQEILVSEKLENLRKSVDHL